MRPLIFSLIFAVLGSVGGVVLGMELTSTPTKRELYLQQANRALEQERVACMPKLQVCLGDLHDCREQCPR